MSEKKRLFLFLKFDGSTLEQIYHSSKYLDDLRGYAILNPPKTSLFNSMLAYYPYSDIHFVIHTNDIDNSMKIYREYSEYIDLKLDIETNYTFTVKHSDDLNIIDSLIDFNREIRELKNTKE